jgi:hypothetical protein
MDGQPVSTGPLVESLPGALRFRVGGLLQCRALVVAVRSITLPAVAALARKLNLDSVLFGDTLTGVRGKILPTPLRVFEDTVASTYWRE